MADAPLSTDIAAEVRSEVEKIFSSKDWRGRTEDTVRRSIRDRRKIAELQALVDAAPKVTDGAVLLTKADAELFNAFKALNLAPDAIKKTLDEHATLVVKVAETEAEGTYAEAGKALGWKNIPAVTRFLKRENLTLEFKDVREKDDDGKTVVKRMPMVKPKNDSKAESTPLDQYVADAVPDFVAVFERDPAESSSESTSSRSVISADLGLVIPETSNITRTPSSDAARKQILDKAEQSARDSGMYSL